jgi:sugar O-acyltransferase (sialic acid O-acetyltransferase NeuD family)
MANVIVFGFGDFADIMHRRLEAEGGHEVVGFTADEAYLPGAVYRGLPTFPFERIEREVSPLEASLFIAVGPSNANALRARYYHAAKAKGYGLVTHVSPRAIVGDDVPIGDNCAVFEGTILEPWTSVGNDSILWSGVLVSHHSRIGDHCFVAPRAAISGRCIVEDYCFLGINSTIRDHVRIGAGCIVGAGALIKKDTEPRSVYSPRRTYLYLDDSTRTKL